MKRAESNRKFKTPSKISASKRNGVNRPGQVLTCVCTHTPRLQEDKIVFDLNLEIQFLLKQGQVEMQMNSFIPNYSSSVMVHRSKIEELNTQIKVSQVY